MISRVELVEQLREFYRNYDLQQGGKLDDDEIDRYHKRIIEEGCLTYELDSYDRLLGYIECWRVTSSQIGKILFDDNFNIYEGNIKDGPICFIANITIRPEHRGGNLLQSLKGRFMTQNNSKFICGRASHGRAKSFKIFSQQQYLEGVRNDVI